MSSVKEKFRNNVFHLSIRIPNLRSVSEPQYHKDKQDYETCLKINRSIY